MAGPICPCYRMEQAIALLKNNSGNITEVAYAVGFNSLSYFSQVFKEHVGKSLSEFSVRILRNQDAGAAHGDE